MKQLQIYKLEMTDSEARYLVPIMMRSFVKMKSYQGVLPNTNALKSLYMKFSKLADELAYGNGE